MCVGKGGGGRGDQFVPSGRGGKGGRKHFGNGVLKKKKIIKQGQTDILRQKLLWVGILNLGFIKKKKKGQTEI